MPVGNEHFVYCFIRWLKNETRKCVRLSENSFYLKIHKPLTNRRKIPCLENMEMCQERRRELNGKRLNKADAFSCVHLKTKFAITKILNSSTATLTNPRSSVRQLLTPTTSQYSHQFVNWRSDTINIYYGDGGYVCGRIFIFTLCMCAICACLYT